MSRIAPGTLVYIGTKMRGILHQGDPENPWYHMENFLA